MSAKLKCLLEKMTDESNTVDLLVGFFDDHGFLMTPPSETPPPIVLAWRKWNKIIFCIHIFTAFIHCPITIFAFWGDAMLTSVMVATSFTFAFFVVHLWCLLYREESIRRLIAALKEMKELGRLHREHAEEVVVEGKGLSKIAMVYFLASTFVLTVMGMFIIPAFCYMKREFLVKFWWPFDIQAIPTFEIMLLIRVTTELYVLFTGVFINCLHLAVLAEIAFQLKLLNDNIIKIVGNSSDKRIDLVQSRQWVKETSKREHQGSGKKSEASVATQDSVGILNDGEELENLEVSQHLKCTPKKVETNDTISTVTSASYIIDDEDTLKQCVKHHQVLSRAVEEVQSAFGPILLFELSCLVIPIVCIIFVILYGKVIDVKTYSFLGLMSSATLQLYMGCFMTEKVMEESEGVRDAVYSCDWVQESDSFKRSIRIMMSRSNQPMVVKLLGIPWSLETFSKVLKLTYSYYTSLSATMGTSQSRNQ